MNLQLVAGDNVTNYREAAAARIKALVVKWTENTLALGRELCEAAETFAPNPKRPTERPGFDRWARETTGLSTVHIFNLMRVYRKFGQRSGDLKLSQRVMILLATDDVPESARIEALGRAERGEKVGGRTARKIIEKHKLPGPKAANQQAKEEGRPVLASDGNIYFGTDPARAKEGEDRRTMVYGVKRALDHLAGIKLTGRQFLDYAFPHQLWTPEEARVIKSALRWLSDLDSAWDNRA